MSVRTVLASAIIGLSAMAVSGCVNDPYYDGYYGYDGYGPYYGGGYYTGTAIIYDSGPRLHHRSRYVELRPHRPHRFHNVQRLRHAHRARQHARQSAPEIRRDYRERQAASAARQDQTGPRNRHEMRHEDRRR